MQFICKYLRDSKQINTSEYFLELDKSMKFITNALLLKNTITNVFFYFESNLKSIVNRKPFQWSMSPFFT